MSPVTLPARERQALLEVGRTTVTPRLAAALTLAFLAIVAGVLALQVVVGPAPGGALADLGRGIAEAPGVAATDGWLAGNRRVLAALDAFETRLEDESVLRARLLPPTQLLLSSRLGAGNEQAYIGRGGWLFYRPDVDYAIGPGFLDAAVMERRRRGGRSWETPPEPDPLPAIVALAEDLGARGVELLLLPAPSKPMLLPGALVWRRTAPPPLDNPSAPRLLADLEAAGVSVLPVGEWLAALSQEEEASFLTTDTHWTPRAMEEVARRLAEEIAGRLAPAPSPAGAPFVRRETVIDGRGDIAVMLRLPGDQEAFAAQRVTVSVVTAANGGAWRPDPAADVLLLGDSFTNVFSDASLGWGQGAGLAEQLSYFLGRHVDRIALNAGGSNAARRALVDALATDPHRLASKKLVVYQFAVRELAFGDWPVLRLPAE
jgi:alginate O-acetyltransferase complex protein AlgJ